MDARGVDRATALVCGPPTALTEQLVLALADDGFDVHRPVHQLGGAPEESALVAAIAGRARPLAVAVLDLTHGATRPGTVEAVVAVMNGHDARARPRLVLLVDDRRPRVRRTDVGAEAHVGVLTVVRHPARPADDDQTSARRLARRIGTARTGRRRAVREPGPARSLPRPVALRATVGRWSW